MDLQADINWIMAELRQVKDPDLINIFKKLLQSRGKHDTIDWWNELSAEERAEIEEGLAQADRGEFISHEEVMKNPRKWA